MPKATIFRCCLCQTAAEMPCFPRRPSRELKPHPLHGWLAFHGFPEHDAILRGGHLPAVVATAARRGGAAVSGREFSVHFQADGRHAFVQTDGPKVLVVVDESGDKPEFVLRLSPQDAIQMGQQLIRVGRRLRGGAESAEEAARR